MATAAAQRRHAGRAGRWASRVLGALGGAIAITGAAWAVSAASAAADEPADTPATSVGQVVDVASAPSDTVLEDASGTAAVDEVPFGVADETAGANDAGDTLPQPVSTASQVHSDPTRTADRPAEQPAPSGSVEHDSTITDTINDVAKHPVLRPVHEVAQAVDEVVHPREQLVKLGTAIETLIPPDPLIHPDENELVELPAVPQPPDSSAPPDDAVEQPGSPSPDADTGHTVVPDTAVSTPDAATDQQLADSAPAINDAGSQAVSPFDVSNPSAFDTHGPDSATPSSPAQLPLAPPATPSTAPSCCASTGSHTDGQAWGMPVGSPTIAGSAAAGAAVPANRTLSVAPGARPGHTPD